MAKKRKKVLKKKTKAKKPAKSKVKTTKKKVKKRTKKNKGGRQTKYTKSHPMIALGYAEDGSYQPSRLAKKFKVSVQTIRNWIKNHPKFAEAVEEGKDTAVDAVDETLHHLALGKVRIKKGVLPPNDRACKNILKAHRKELYGDKLAVGGPDGKSIPVTIVDFADIPDDT